MQGRSLACLEASKRLRRKEPLPTKFPKPISTASFSPKKSQIDHPSTKLADIPHTLRFTDTRPSKASNSYHAKIRNLNSDFFDFTLHNDHCLQPKTAAVDLSHNHGQTATPPAQPSSPIDRRLPAPNLPSHLLNVVVGFRLRLIGGIALRDNERYPGFPFSLNRFEPALLLFPAWHLRCFR